MKRGGTSAPARYCLCEITSPLKAPQDREILPAGYVGVTRLLGDSSTLRSTEGGKLLTGLDLRLEPTPGFEPGTC